MTTDTAQFAARHAAFACATACLLWMSGLAGCSSSSTPADAQTPADSDNAGTELPASSTGRLSGKLVLTGSSTVAPLASEIAVRFEEMHPQVRIDVQTGGSSRGIADARSGVADIGMASRGLKPDESDLTAHQLAVDGVCLIAHGDNPVSALSDEQVVAVFTKQITNWKDLGGGDSTIVVVNKAAGRATLEIFESHFGLGDNQIQADIIIGDNQQGIKTVTGNPAAIGYVSIGSADYEVRNGAKLKLIKAGDIAPSLQNVATGKFPITRPLLLVTSGEPAGLALEFIRFATSPAVNDLIKAQYFVPVAK